MKKVAALTTIVLSLTGMHGARAAEHKENTQHKRTSAGSENKRTGVRVASGDWGNAAPDEIEILLNAVAGEMLKHFPGHQLDPIVVSPSRSGPVVLYQKGAQHEYQILLAAKGDRWAEYVYEFSHELFHVLANYEYHAPPRQARHQWFEEMLCETVSLYMLKRFSLTWEQSPPKDEWRYYATDLRRFTQRALTEPHRQLPGNVSFQQSLTGARSPISISMCRRASPAFMITLRTGIARHPSRIGGSSARQWACSISGNRQKENLCWPSISVRQNRANRRKYRKARPAPQRDKRAIAVR
jgi:hypothetical protein